MDHKFKTFLSLFYTKYSFSTRELESFSLCKQDDLQRKRSCLNTRKIILNGQCSSVLKASRFQSKLLKHVMKEVTRTLNSYDVKIEMRPLQYYFRLQ